MVGHCDSKIGESMSVALVLHGWLSLTHALESQYHAGNARYCKLLNGIGER